MPLKLLYSAVTGELDTALRGIYRPIAIAATGAIRDAAAEIKTQGRANIASAGFSRKWQNALRVDVFPKTGASADAALQARHKIPYAGVFERGAIISGKPLLWIPVTGAPARIGGRKFTPKNYRQLVGPLRSFRSRKGTPLLGGPIAGRLGSKITVAKLRRGQRGQSGRSGISFQPLFVGITTARIRPRFGLQAIFNRAQAGLGAAYLRHLPD